MDIEGDAGASRLEGRVDSIEQRLLRLESASNLTAKDVRVVRDIIESWNSLKGFGTTVRWVSVSLGVAVKIVIAAGIIWGLLKAGVWPKADSP